MKLPASWRFRMADAGGRLLLDPLLATLRFQIRGEEHIEQLRAAGRGFIFVLWHGRLLAPTYYHRHQDIVTIISQSDDGEYIARVVERWGYEVIRGSSSRGGKRALYKLVRAARDGRVLAVTPDGPRGPKQKMKLGPLEIARRASSPLVPLVAASDRAWWFESWDRFLVPQPFATVRVAYGKPHEVPADANQQELERRAEKLECDLNRLLEEADTGAGFE